ncbi:MAG TPA: type II toxin-antitoxin system HicA family toxin [Candidatus Woesebacteria bacterium]|nr:type II toxin-antitoxin system HicA family toxin [Candidatus Woesebacteria bacterium]
MVKLPSFTAKRLLKVLLKNGFEIRRQTGSNARLIHPDGRATTIAIHNRDIARGTLRAVLKQTGLKITDLHK